MVMASIYDDSNEPAKAMSRFLILEPTSQRTDLEGVREWILNVANRQRATEFVQWSQKYGWPK